MPATIAVGAQWGDEGKGRVVDWLAADADYVARYAGGDNAGHTVMVGQTVFKLHLIPSGILRPEVSCILGNGMVINPVNLWEELKGVEANGVNVNRERLAISTRAHLITPAHIARDAAAELARGSQAIGTTLRGIGPAYVDKTARRGIRAGDMLDTARFAAAIREAVHQASELLTQQNKPALDVTAHTDRYVAAAVALQPYIQDTSSLLNEGLAVGKRVLAEGAQGSLLDIDHGDYPFVTSSSATAGGAMIGLGIGPRYVDRVIGIAKAFSTRVGSGPMPTELEGALGDRLRGTGEHFWDEFGTTTGRPRRCGWLDIVSLRYSAQVNGFTELFLTKLDVLSGLDEVMIATAYIVNGEQIDHPPSTLTQLERAQPVYERLEGWSEDISAARTLSDLPKAVRRYVDRIQELLHVPMLGVSVGPERDQLVIMKD